MRTRKGILLLMSVLAVGIVAIFSHSNEPRYKGHSLSYWVNLYGDTRWDERGDAQAQEAISHIGTNALPSLLRWIRYEEHPSWVRSAALFFFSLRIPKTLTPESVVRFLCEDRAAKRGDNAVHAFYLLRSQISPVLPELFNLMNSYNSTNRTTGTYFDPSVRALFALIHSSSDDALPLFFTHIANSNAPNRAAVVGLLEHYDLTTNTGPIVPMLIQCMVDNDTNVVRAAGRTLLRFDSKPGLIVSALTNCVSASTNALLRCRAISILGWYGSESRPAESLLLVASHDADAEVRRHASNALVKITVASITNAPGY